MTDTKKPVYVAYCEDGPDRNDNHGFLYSICQEDDTDTHNCFAYARADTEKEASTRAKYIVKALNMFQCGQEREPEYSYRMQEIRLRAAAADYSEAGRLDIHYLLNYIEKLEERSELAGP